MWYTSFYNDFLDHQYVSLAIQYFILARFGSQFLFNPSSGSLYHLSFELLFKSYLINNGYSAEMLKDDFGHNLVKLWNEFKTKLIKEELDRFDLVVKNLDAWDRVRYISLEKNRNASEIAILKGHADKAYLHEVEHATFHTQMRFLLHTDDMDELFFIFFLTLGIPPEELLKAPDFSLGREFYERNNKFNFVKGY